MLQATQDPIKLAEGPVPHVVIILVPQEVEHVEGDSLVEVAGTHEVQDIVDDLATDEK